VFQASWVFGSGTLYRVNLLAGRFLFQESVPGPTWAGLALIVAGGLTIQFGPKFWH